MADGPGEGADDLDLDLDLDGVWPDLPDSDDEFEMWPKERRRPRLSGRGRKKKATGPVPVIKDPAPVVPPPATPEVPAGQITPDQGEDDVGPSSDPPAPARPRKAAKRASTPAVTADLPVPDPPAPSVKPVAPPARSAAPKVTVRAARQEPAASGPEPPRRDRSEPGRDSSGVALNLARFRAMQDEATVEVLDAVSNVDEAVQRVERLSAALAEELAEVAQVICDEGDRQALETQERLAGSLATLGEDVETLGETVADALAGLKAGLAGGTVKGAGASGLERSLKQLAQGTDRVEALVEDVLIAVAERPTDVSELTAKTLERLGLTVGARVEAATTMAVEALEKAVDKALARASEQFRDLAPPTVDRSTTAAVVRLEERVAELSRQREEHEASTQQTLDSLGATLERLALAQAEDLERILDTIEASRSTSPADPDDRVGRLTTSLESIADLPATTDELVSVVAEQTAAFNTQMEAVRRRLSLRARGATLDRAALEQLADMVAAKLRQEGSRDS